MFFKNPFTLGLYQKKTKSIFIRIFLDAPFYKSFNTQLFEICICYLFRLHIIFHTFLKIFWDIHVAPASKLLRITVHLGLVKGTVSRDFGPFFCFKDSTWAPYKHANTVSRTFSFSRIQYIRENRVSASTTTRTSCQRSQQLR